jgi:hypothetical protein
MIARLALSAVLLVSFSLVACASADEAGATDGTDVGAADVTSTRLYDCSTSSDQDQLKRFELAMSPTTAQITDISKDALAPDSGRIDPTYRPTPDFAGSIRYRGFDKMTSAMDEVSQLDLIVPKAFQDSPDQGKLLIRETGPEGGGSTSYFCRSKTKKLTVEVSRHARFTCRLGLECTHDNPPGETCLDTAFINQTGDREANLKITFLDHFGVHAQERPVDVGASSKFDRTTEKFSASFAGDDVNLTYRGGITYVGKLKLSDGRTSDATCNDLAMLD